MKSIGDPVRLMKCDAVAHEYLQSRPSLAPCPVTPNARNQRRAQRVRWIEMLGLIAFQVLLGLKLLPCVPFFYDLAVHNASEIDAN